MRKAFRLLALASILVLPSPAAAGEWRSLGDLSDRGLSSAGISYGVDDAGAFTLLYRDLREDGLSDEIGPLHARDRRPGERVENGASFGTGNTSLVDLAIGPGGERIAAYGAGPDGSARVEVRFRDRTGEWGEPVVVAQNMRRVANTQVVAAPSGEIVVAWHDTATPKEQTHPFDPNPATLYASGRSAGGATFDAPRALGTVSSPAWSQLEADDAGNAIVAWIDDIARVVRTARRPAGGSFGASEPHVVSGLPADAGPPGLAVAPGGRAVLSWPVGEIDPVGRGPQAATAGTTTRGFDPPVVVSRNAGPYGDVAADDRIAAVTWVEDPSVRGRVRSVLAGPDERIGERRARTVSRRAVRDFRFDQTSAARGRVTYAWDRQTRGERVIEARTATASGRFTRTQTLSSRSRESFTPVTATSRRGEPWVAWVARDRMRRLEGVETAKASSRDGVFGRAQRLPRVPSLDLLELIPGRGGSMFVLQRPSWLRLHVYGER